MSAITVAEAFHHEKHEHELLLRRVCALQSWEQSLHLVWAWSVGVEAQLHHVS